MKNRFLGRGVLPLAAIAAALCISLPVQAQVISKASPYRMRAGGRQVTPVSAALPTSLGVLASEWIEVRKSANVTGDVVVNSDTMGAYPSGFSLSIDGAGVTGTAKGASVNVAKFSNVTNVCTDALTNGGGTISGVTGPYATAGVAPCDDTPPFYSPLPPFHAAQPGSTTVNVPSGGTLTIGADRYGAITVGKNADLYITGGVVEAESVYLDAGANVHFQAATELRVAGRFNATKSNEVGPAAGSGLSAVDIVIYVGGGNVSGSAFDSAGVVGEASDATANFYVANGTFDLGKQATLAGSVVAQSVIIETSAALSANNAFTNQAPSAEPQNVLTNGAASIDIILKGSDPEGEDLTFSTVTPPTASIGTITSPVPIIPDEPADRCSVSGTVCTVDGDCPPSETCVDGGDRAPVTMATVTYTPVAPAANATNSFTFQVADPPGLTATAVVSINDIYDNSPPPAPSTAVDAHDITAETVTDTPVTISLSAGACEGSSLSFAITSLPASGTLSDGGTDLETPQTLSGATVVFTPESGFDGNVTFGYSATDNGTSGACTTTVDNATVTVNVAAEADLAPEQTVETTQNEPVEFILGKIETPPAAPLKMAKVAAGLPEANAPLPGATIAGNVLSVDGTTGDYTDPLPGPSPVLISAGVNQISGSVPTSTWTLTGVTFDDGGAASGTFDYDPNTETVSNWNISVTDDGGSFTEVTYSPANSTVTVSCLFAVCPDEQEKSIQFTIDIPNQSNDRQLRITPVAALTSSGGNIAINLNTAPTGNPSGSEECFNCSPSRLIDGGSLVGNSPPVTSRIEIEWDVTTLPLEPSGILGCQVTLTTNKGSVDTLDTSFYAGAAEQNGALDAADFQAPVGITPLATMPVSIGVSGTDVPYSFDVTSAVQSARAAGINYFSILGKVDEGSAGSGAQRGLQIYSSASGNLLVQKQPQLVCTTGEPTGSQILWEVLSLPSGGTLLGPSGTLVFVGQTFSFQPTMTFYSASAGTFSFNYRVTSGSIVDTATVTLMVASGDTCVIDGRRASCSHTQCSDGLDNDGDYVPAVLGPANETVIPAHGGIDWDGVGGIYPPDPSCTGPSDDDEFPVDP